ncbi:MAG: radical SAM protein [Planctomycetota bacterium]|nr:radical SAM protein [Planctomycetota bacterium]
MRVSHIPLQKGIIYGPVSSKRLGRSLGINLLPRGQKVCTFNCVYCFYGKTISVDSSDFPSPSQVVEALENSLNRVGEIDYITFAGNGEPTLHPCFDEVVSAVVEVRNKFRPKIPLALLSNASRTAEERVRRALKMLDLPVLKLDSGDEETFEKINRPLIPLKVSEIIENLSQLKGEIKKLVVQTVAVCGALTNTQDKCVTKWIHALKKIDPYQVQLYTLDNPFDSLNITPCPFSSLERIVALARKEAIPVTLYI